MDTFILGIESSCDETAASVVKNGRQILSNIISSQVDLHKQYGGVVPEIASRKHVELIIPVIQQALDVAGVSLNEIDAIGVTYGPGLVGALLVGITAAKAIAFTADKPLVGVHHIEGHISANYLQYPELEPPFVCLVASGGHSHIVHVKTHDSYEILGQTRDDAAGEAFDKISRAIGLGYPGGPLIDNHAKEGSNKAIQFPRVYFEDGTLDFSFSGLKTAVLNYLNRMEQSGEKINIPDVAASFQQAVVDVLVKNTIQAARQKDIKTIALAGGVAANTQLRKDMKDRAKEYGIEVIYPSPILCTDNAAMIASAAYYEFIHGKRAGLDLNAIPGLKLS